MPKLFLDPTNISRKILTDGVAPLNDGEAIAIPVADSIAIDGVPISSSASLMTFGDGASEESFNPSDTIFCAGSITKMITAATVVRMTEEEKYKGYLADGVDTKLSNILPLLKKHYPDSRYINEELEKQPNFDQITLQHLMQHTSGLSNFSGRALIDDLYENVNRRISKEMLDTEKSPGSGGNIGEHFYNNVGYELLGRIAVSLASEVAESRRGFGDAVNELVIDRVREKVGREVKFFTADWMEIDSAGRTRVKNHPELNVEFGKHYHDGKFLQIVPSCIYRDMTAGGGYTTPNSMSMIAFHVLSDKAEFSIFKKPETLEIFNSRQVQAPDGYYRGEGSHTYGLGYRSFSDPDRRKYRGHAGLDFGSSSEVTVDIQENKVATTMVAYENLTLPIAYALKNKTKSADQVEIDQELYEKTLELSKNYSESQLLEMRNDLEKSYEDFREKFEATQRQRMEALDLAISPNSSVIPKKTSQAKTTFKSNEI